MTGAPRAGRLTRMIKPIRAGGVTAGPWPRNSLEGEASPRICDTQRPFQWGASVVIVARRALWVVSSKTILCWKKMTSDANIPSKKAKEGIRQWFFPYDGADTPPRGWAQGPLRQRARVRPISLPLSPLKPACASRCSLPHHHHKYLTPPLNRFDLCPLPCVFRGQLPNVRCHRRRPVRWRPLPRRTGVCR